MDRLVSERLDLIQQRDGKLRQVTHLAEMVADLKLQLESMQQQDSYKTQLYGMYRLEYLACPVSMSNYYHLHCVSKNALTLNRYCSKS